MLYISKKCLVGDLVVFECFYFGLVGKVVVWRKFLVVSENFNLATLLTSLRFKVQSARLDVRVPT